MRARAFRAQHLDLVAHSPPVHRSRPQLGFSAAGRPRSCSASSKTSIIGRVRWLQYANDRHRRNFLSRFARATIRAWYAGYISMKSSTYPAPMFPSTASDGAAATSPQITRHPCAGLVSICRVAFSYAHQSRLGHFRRDEPRTQTLQSSAKLSGSRRAIGAHSIAFLGVCPPIEGTTIASSDSRLLKIMSRSAARAIGPFGSLLEPRSGQYIHDDGRRAFLRRNERRGARLPPLVFQYG
jgi:hypothetical protein